MAQDYYEILGISRDATKEEIKKAYKRLAKKYHPDLHKGDKQKEAKFKEINEAYKVLSDDKKRANYDRFGNADFSQDFAGFSGFSGFSEGFDFGDIFEGIFGGVAGAAGGFSRRRGNDLVTHLKITLEDAYHGTEKTIILNKQEICSRCKGTGAYSDSDIVTCSDCHGSGHIRRTRRTPFGMFSTTTTCSKCSGIGKEVKKYCSVCDGEGKEAKAKRIKVKIPPGIHSGQKLRVKGEGEVGDPGMPPGDLFVKIIVKEHEKFERKEDDIYVSVPISFVQAALGTEITVDTLSGKVKLKIPAGTQSHTLFRLRGKGMPKLHGFGYGDEKVQVIVQVPEKLTKKQKELLQEFAEAGGDKVKSIKKGFLKNWVFMK